MPDAPHKERVAVAFYVGHVRNLDGLILGPRGESHPGAPDHIQGKGPTDREAEPPGGEFRLAEPALRRTRRREAPGPQDSQHRSEPAGGLERKLGTEVGEFLDRAEVAGVAAGGVELERDAAVGSLLNHRHPNEIRRDPARNQHLGQYRRGLEAGNVGSSRSSGVARAIRVGVRVVPADARDPQSLARIVELAAEAEAAGIALLAVPERLGVGGVPAALLVCAAAAAITERLVIATAVLPLPLHHPLRVAEDVATLDGIAGGRFELGIGLGADRGELAGFGLEAEDRGGRFEEAIAILRAAWDEGPIQFEGRHFQLDGIEVFPKPARPGGPPLWVGARAELALRRAARLDLGVLVDVRTEVSPYLHESLEAGSRPRVAVTGAGAEAADRANELATNPDVAVDLWLELDPAKPHGLDEVHRLADTLSS